MYEELARYSQNQRCAYGKLILLLESALIVIIVNADSLIYSTSKNLNSCQILVLPLDE